MSSISTTHDVPCELCATANPATNAYCGGCGAMLYASAQPAVASDHRGYRGPRRLLVVSGVLFVVSAIIATAAFFAIQATGLTDVAKDTGTPLVNSILGQFGVDITVPESEDTGASWLIVATFLVAFLIAGISLLLTVVGSLWLLTRWATRDRRPGDTRPVTTHVAVASRRQAAAAIGRGSQEYAKAKPKIAEAAQKGRKTLDENVMPRVSAGAGKAAAKSRQWVEERRRERLPSPPPPTPPPPPPPPPPPGGPPDHG